MRRSLIPVTLALMSIVAAGAARNRSVDQRGVLSAIAQAPSKARAEKNPYDDRPEAVAAGAKLFRQHCAECHGDDAHGIGHAADLHSTGVQNATPGELAWFLRNGNLAYGMPSWSGLPEQRRWQIVAYLKTLN
jgi:mono/diheme cytochrome c family protein